MHEKSAPRMDISPIPTPAMFEKTASEARAALENLNNESSAEERREALEKLECSAEIAERFYQKREQLFFTILLARNIAVATDHFSYFEIQKDYKKTEATLNRVLNSSHPSTAKAREKIKKNILPPREIMAILDEISTRVPDDWRQKEAPEHRLLSLYLTSPEEDFLAALTSFCDAHDVDMEQAIEKSFLPKPRFAIIEGNGKENEKNSGDDDC